MRFFLFPKIIFAVLLVFVIQELTAQEIAVPVKLQVSLFSKIVSFDRKFEERTGKELVIGIVFQQSFRNALLVKDELVATLESISDGKISGILFRYVPIDISEKTNLRQIVEQENIDVLYICPLRAMEMETITSVSQTYHAMTFTGVPEFVERGISTGIGLKGEKPQILIHLSSSKAEGIEYTSQLLKLAKIFSPPIPNE